MPVTRVSVLRFVGIFSLVLTLLAAVNFYVHRRAVQTFRLGRFGKIALLVVQLAGLGAMIAARAAERALGAPTAAVIGVWAGAIELSIVVSFALLLLVDAVRGVFALGGSLRRRSAKRRARPPTDGDAPVEAHDARSIASADEPSAETRDAASLALSAESTPTATASQSSSVALPALPALARREFLSRAATGTALALGAGSAFYGAFFGRHDYRTETVPVRIPGLPRTLDGFTIVQISDIHFGVYARGDEVRVASELIRRARPDLVVITGDIIDHDDAYSPYLGQLIERITGAARHGTVVIPGNHDYYAGIERVLATARSAGAKVLVNEGRVIGDAGGGFALLGVDDIWRRREGGGPDLDRAIATVPRDLPRILLCHNPAFFPEAAGKIALQLSGHTHGGQVNVGPRLADYVLPFGYVAGLYDRADSQLYVNRGFGTAGPPTRVGSPPEITRIVLVAA